MELTDYQKHRLMVWLECQRATYAISQIAGYPLGNSYIDSRSNGGKDITKRRAYVKLDHETAKLVPQCRGRSAEQIAAILKGKN
jgi:hypothetical protein